MVAEGTLEWYRQIYMNEGLMAMIKTVSNVMKEAGRKPTLARVNKFVAAILYGSNTNGTIRHQPPQPDPNDITKNYGKYKFEKKVFGCWVNEQLNEKEGLGVSKWRPQ